jgi:hypothetical protein
MRMFVDDSDLEPDAGIATLHNEGNYGSTALCDLHWKCSARQPRDGVSNIPAANASSTDPVTV